MKSLIDYFKCGNLYIDREVVIFRISKFSDILNTIIPFFEKYPILGVKSLDLNDFCKVAQIIKNKNHLTEKGLEEIKLLKDGMNRGRKTADTENIYSDQHSSKTNLTNSIFKTQKRSFHSSVRAINRIGPHDKEIISVIIGSLLGDAYANSRTIDGVRFCYRQSDKHQKYLLYLYNFFYERGYCLKNGISTI